MANTVVLMHFDNNFTDATGRHTFNASLGFSETYKKFGTHGLDASTGSRDMTITDNLSDFDFGTGDFTIDYWHYRLSGSNQVGFAIRRVSNLLISIQYYSGLVYLYIDSASYTNTGANHVSGSWIHNALVRHGDNIYYYLNGSRVWSNSGYASYNFTGTDSVTIGSVGSSSDFYGYLDELRVVNDEAVWTGSSFDVPTQPYSLGPNYQISGNTSEAGKLILLSADDYSMIGTEDINVGNFNKAVDYGKKVVLLRNTLGKIDGVGEVMPTTL